MDYNRSRRLARERISAVRAGRRAAAEVAATARDERLARERIAAMRESRRAAAEAVAAARDERPAREETAAMQERRQAAAEAVTRAREGHRPAPGAAAGAAGVGTPPHPIPRGQQLIATRGMGVVAGVGAASGSGAGVGSSGGGRAHAGAPAGAATEEEDGEVDALDDGAPLRPRGAYGEEIFAGDASRVPDASGFGGMTVVCIHCHALHWPGERLAASSLSNPRFGKCCSGGNAILPAMPDPPEPLRTWDEAATPAARDMLSHVRLLNNATSLTSMKARRPQALPGSSNYDPSARLDGQRTHVVGPMLASGGHEASFLQAYFLDRAENESRLADVCRAMGGAVDAAGGAGGAHGRVSVSRLTVEGGQLLFGLQQLDGMLKERNVLIREFRTARERVQAIEAAAGGAPIPSLRVVISEDARPEGADVRVYNAPTSEEAAVVLPLTDLEAAHQDAGGAWNRELVLQVRLQPGTGAPGARPAAVLRKIKPTSRFYEPAQYPIIFPLGTHGWYAGIRQTVRDRALTALDYVAYYLFTRDVAFNYLHRLNRLFGVYNVDMYVRVEHARLEYRRHNQKRLRCKGYSRFLDVV